MDVITSGIMPIIKKQGDNEAGVHMVDIDKGKEDKYNKNE